MKIIVTIFFIFSAILFWGAFKCILDLTRPGVYPPKLMLKKRAAALLAGGGIFLLIAVIFSKF
jgi:hypothetical protein